MKKILITFCIVILSVVQVLAEVTFVAKVTGGNTVEAGTRFQVEYELNESCDNFSCDSPEGVRVLSGPFSSTYMSRSMVNGKTSVSQTTTYTYVMMAEKEGSYTLPAAKAVVGGKSYTSNSITLKVLPADPNHQAQASQQSSQRSSSQSSSKGGVAKDDVLLGIDLSKASVYEGEGLVATLKLYFRNQNVASVNEVKFPDMAGFTAQDIDLGDNVQATLESYHGESYRAYPIHQWLLFPQHSGDIHIKPGSLNAIVQVYTGRRSFWDDPFNVYQNVSVPVSSPERSVKVKALPAGKPASYMNAVGEFKITSDMTSTQLKANDAVIYRLTIEGNGNLKYVREPKPEFPADFEVYDPKIDVQTKATRSGLTGKKVIEYTIIPRFGGTFKIPSVAFSYFDPKEGKYKTIVTKPYTVEVEKGANDAVSTPTTGNADFTGANQERIKILGSDIRYIPNNQQLLDTLSADETPLFGRVGYWLWFVLPGLAFLALVFVYRRQLRLSADVVGQRTRKANKVASRRLRMAAQALRDRQESDFYEAVHKAVMGYMADKLNIPISELTTDSIRETLAARGIADDEVKQCVDVLQTCEFARYAPSADAQAMDKLYEEADGVINRLEKAL